MWGHSVPGPAGGAAPAHGSVSVPEILGPRPGPAQPASSGPQRSGVRPCPKAREPANKRRTRALMLGVRSGSRVGTCGPRAARSAPLRGSQASPTPAPAPPTAPARPVVSLVSAPWGVARAPPAEATPQHGREERRPSLGAGGGGRWGPSSAGAKTARRAPGSEGSARLPAGERIPSPPRLRPCDPKGQAAATRKDRCALLAPRSGSPPPPPPAPPGPGQREGQRGPCLRPDRGACPALRVTIPRAAGPGGCPSTASGRSAPEPAARNANPRHIT